MSMIIENKKYHIELEFDNTYIIGSDRNKHYDIILNPANYRLGDLYKTLSISIDLVSKKYNIALISSVYSFDSDCAVLEDNILTLLQNDLLIKINIENGSIISYKRFDKHGCPFHIYKVKDMFIIHGEEYILMVDNELNEKWSFSGLDIFTSATGKNCFELKENCIYLYDFSDNYYKLDFCGNVIEKSF